MNITLILFIIGILGFLLNRKNIILYTRKFLTLESYKNVDLIAGLAFKLLIEGPFILILTLSFSRFMVSEFFGRDDSVIGFIARFIVRYNTIKSFTDAITIGLKSGEVCALNKYVLLAK
jgi:hypothetical protein